MRNRVAGEIALEYDRTKKVHFCLVLIRTQEGKKHNNSFVLIRRDTKVQKKVRKVRPHKSFIT